MPFNEFGYWEDERPGTPGYVGLDGFIGDSPLGTSIGSLASGYNVIADLNNRGIPPAQGAGIAGSFGVETGEFGKGSQIGGGPGRGYGQWEISGGGGSGRGDALVNYMRSTGQGVMPDGSLNFRDPAANMGYFGQELYGGTAGYPEYGVWGRDALRSDSPASAAQAFTAEYLRPSVPHMERRQDLANVYSDYYQSQQDPGYRSGNYYGDYGSLGDIFRLPAAQSWSGDRGNDYGYGGEGAPGLRDPYTGGLGNAAWAMGSTFDTPRHSDPMPAPLEFTVGGPQQRMGGLYESGGLPNLVTAPQPAVSASLSSASGGDWFGGANDGSPGNMGSAGGIAGGGTAGIMPEGRPTSYSWGQDYMGRLAAQNDAKLAALPSSPQNFSPSFQPMVDRNIAALNPTSIFNTYAANTLPQFDFSYAAPPVFY